jgi:carbamoyl-phosphate synthase large subunit
MSSISIKKYLKGGQTYKAFIDDYPNVRISAEKIAEKLGVTGAVNIQAKYVPDDEKTTSARTTAEHESRSLDISLQSGRLKTFEINPRFSATCPLRSYAGINEPDIVIRNAVFDEKIEKVNSYRRLVCMRYWNVYVDLADFEKLKNTGLIRQGLKNSNTPTYF